MTVLDVKLDGLAATVRCSSEESEAARKNLEAAVAARCDQMNEVIMVTSARADTLRQEVEQSMLNTKLELADVRPLSGFLTMLSMPWRM
eukprot:3965425-Amphidinium_carterae.1